MISSLQDAAALNANSILFDFGSGRGKFAAYFAQHVRGVMGVEYTPLRWQISQGLVANCDVDNVILVNVDGTQLSTFAPATIFCSFNVGMPPEVLSCMMETIANTPTLCWVLVFTPFDLPGWKHVQTYSNWPMAGSGETPRGYLYKRDGANSKSRRTSWKKLARMAAPEFQAGLNMAGVPGELKKAAIEASQEFQNTPRKTRRMDGH
jgi:hypothetical protein